MFGASDDILQEPISTLPPLWLVVDKGLLLTKRNVFFIYSSSRERDYR